MRILQVVSTFDMGGIETMLLHLLEEGMRFDACALIPDHGILENDMNRLGCKTYHLTRRSKNAAKHHVDLYKIIKNGHYDVVHFHTQNAFFTYLHVCVARLAGAKVIAVHSHNTNDWRDQKKRDLNIKYRKKLYDAADVRIACGEDAAKWLFGTTDKVTILPLPIRTKNFLATDEKRDEIRKAIGIRKNDILILHIGRFNDAKNHKYLMDALAPLLAGQKKTRLFLMGDGELIEDIKQQVFYFDIGEQVCFLGNLKRPEKYFIAADIFLLPSKYEGFPTVLLEAQAAGVSCVVSNTIDKRINVTGDVSFVPIDEKSKGAWLVAAKYAVPNNEGLRLAMNRLVANWYDASITKHKLEELYSHALRKNR